jgi:hypothetical protein
MRVRDIEGMDRTKHGGLGALEFAVQKGQIALHDAYGEGAFITSVEGLAAGCTCRAGGEAVERPIAKRARSFDEVLRLCG